MDRVPTQSTVDLSDYVAMLRRRKLHFLIPFSVILLVSLIVAFILPPIYQSTATILVEEQGIPSSIVQTTVTGYVQARIQALTESLLTRERLWDIAERLDLYPGERNPDNKTHIVRSMRQNIEVTPENVRATDPGSNKSTEVTVSFSVSFSADDPTVAQKVAAELAKLYLEENRKERTQKTEEVTQFLKQEAERYRLQIVETESKLAAFKQTNVGLLPELASANLRFVEQTDAEVSRVEERIRSTEQQIALLQTQLSMTEPNLFYSSQGNRSLGPIQQLRALQAQYAEARQKYSEEHPDIKYLKNQIAALEQTIKDNPNSAAGQGATAAPDNPAYIALQAQLEAAKANLNSAKEERAHLKARLAEYEARLLKTPVVERDYLTLTRNYEIAIRNYQDIQQKLQRAGLAQQLEEEAKGETFRLVGSPDLPLEPIKPNRPAIVFLGLVLALGGGMGTLSLAEYLDKTVRGFRGVEAILHVPPLAGIPYIMIPTDTAPKRKQRLAALFIALLIAVVALLLLANQYWAPIDQLWLTAVEMFNESPLGQALTQ